MTDHAGDPCKTCACVPTEGSKGLGTKVCVAAVYISPQLVSSSGGSSSSGTRLSSSRSSANVARLTRFCRDPPLSPRTDCITNLVVHEFTSVTLESATINWQKFSSFVVCEKEGRHVSSVVMCATVN